MRRQCLFESQEAFDAVHRHQTAVQDADSLVAQIDQVGYGLQHRVKIVDTHRIDFLLPEILVDEDKRRFLKSPIANLLGDFVMIDNIVDQYTIDPPVINYPHVGKLFFGPIFG